WAAEWICIIGASGWSDHIFGEKSGITQGLPPSRPPGARHFAGAVLETKVGVLDTLGPCAVDRLNFGRNDESASAVVTVRDWVDGGDRRLRAGRTTGGCADRAHPHIDQRQSGPGRSRRGERWWLSGPDRCPGAAGLGRISYRPEFASGHLRRASHRSYPDHGR